VVLVRQMALLAAISKVRKETTPYSVQSLLRAAVVALEPLPRLEATEVLAVEELIKAQRVLETLQAHHHLKVMMAD
jgi:hypothetical protein